RVAHRLVELAGTVRSPRSYDRWMRPDHLFRRSRNWWTDTESDGVGELAANLCRPPLLAFGTSLGDMCGHSGGTRAFGGGAAPLDHGDCAERRSAPLRRERRSFAAARRSTTNVAGRHRLGL